MKNAVQRYLIWGLSAVCALAAIALVPAVHLPRGDGAGRREKARAVPQPPEEAFSRLPPSMSEVVSKHLFIPQRKATGQNSFPDLVVKGVFLGTERSAVFSLKSKPQANLRVWAGGALAAVGQITDPRDPRQPIAQFLREWNIKEITFSGVVMQHFITGEQETYAVNYTPDRKVKDDALRGYGQGLMPQAEAAQTAGARSPAARNGTAAQAGQPGGSPAAIGQMADRISAMLQRMSPDQKKQLLQRMGQNAGAQSGNPQKAAAQNGGTSKTGTKPAATGKTPAAAPKKR